jgi:hypothetical protein
MGDDDVHDPGRQLSQAVRGFEGGQGQLQLGMDIAQPGQRVGDEPLGGAGERADAKTA